MSIPLLALFSGFLFKAALVLLAIYVLLIFVDATFKNESLQVGILSIAAVFVQLFGYGIGFLTEGWRKMKESKK
jgi:hypothetical protein